MQGLRHVESFAIRFLAGQAAVASLAGTRLRTTRSPRPGQPAPLLQRCRARNTETHHRLRLTHPTVNHGPRCGDLGLIVVFGPLYSHGKKPAPPDHAVHLLPLSHSLGRHTKPPGGQTIAKSPLKHLHRLLPKQTIMPQPQIHRHEKPPIPWTSISMSKKREAVQSTRPRLPQAIMLRPGGTSSRRDPRRGPTGCQSGACGSRGSSPPPRSPRRSHRQPGA